MELTQHITSLAQFQQAIQQLSEAQPRADQKSLFNPRDEVLIKSLPSLSPMLDPVWKGPYTVILSTPMAIKVSEFDSWIHHSQVKPWTNTPPKTEEDDKGPKCSSQPLEDLKFLLHRTGKYSDDKI